VIVWRVISADFEASPLSAEGSRRLGGRWNPAGVAVLYTASSEALAYLERFVHLGPELKDSPHLMLQIEVPDATGVESVEQAQLPPDWKSIPIPASAQALGREWANRGKALAMVVPSALTGSDRNILLNATHPAFTRVRVVEQRPFIYDPRMWKFRGAAEPEQPRRRR
jgi:RES domain-containing protein